MTRLALLLGVLGVGCRVDVTSDEFSWPAAVASGLLAYALLTLYWRRRP